MLAIAITFCQRSHQCHPGMWCFGRIFHLLKFSISSGSAPINPTIYASIYASTTFIPCVFVHILFCINQFKYVNSIPELRTELLSSNWLASLFSSLFTRLVVWCHWLHPLACRGSSHLVFGWKAWLSGQRILCCINGIFLAWLQPGFFPTKWYSKQLKP